MRGKNKKKDKNNKEVNIEKESAEETSFETHEQDISASSGEISREPETSENSATVIDSEDKLKALNDKYVRLLAEYDNFRKRAAREMIELSKTANEELMKEFLSILDNLDLATEHKNDKTTFEEYVQGIALIEDQLREVLSHAGLEAIEAVGTPFDPNIHYAVMQQESEEFDSGMVASEVQKGYTLSGKIIRHSKVVVSK